MRAALGLLALSIAILLAPGHAEVGRAALAEGYAERVVGAGLVELPPASPLRSVVRDGRRVGEVGPLDVAVALPGAVLARIGAAADAGARRALGGVVVPLFLFVTLGSVFFARLHRRRGLQLSAVTAGAATIALLFSTSVLWGARRGDATLVAAVALALLLDELEAPTTASLPRHLLQAGLLGTTLALAQPAYAACAIALLVLDVGRRVAGRPRLLVGLAVVSPVLLAMAASRVWDARLGLATAPSDARLHALYGLLLSPGRSLFVYSPIALLGVAGFPRLWERDRARAQAVAIAVLAALFAIAGRADWHGDPAFGPPLVVPLLSLFVEPAALLFDRSRSWRLGFIGLATLGVLVQALGLSVDVEAWPRVIADLRASTGAPGWFLDPAADIEFVPQLSPLVGQWTIAKIALGRTLGPDPPFSLVVGSDQADASSPPAIEAVWTGVRNRIDRASLRPNLALLAGGKADAALQLGLFALTFLAGLILALRPRRSRSDSGGEPWPRG